MFRRFNFVQKCSKKQDPMIFLKMVIGLQIQGGDWPPGKSTFIVGMSHQISESLRFFKFSDFRGFLESLVPGKFCNPTEKTQPKVVIGLPESLVPGKFCIPTEKRQPKVVIGLQEHPRLQLGCLIRFLKV